MDMRIANNNAMRTFEIQRSERHAAPERANKIEERADMLTLSSKAKDFALASKAIANTPDIREDKVQSIKAQIEAGAYNVTGMDVANKLFA